MDRPAPAAAAPQDSTDPALRGAAAASDTAVAACTTGCSRRAWHADAPMCGWPCLRATCAHSSPPRFPRGRLTESPVDAARRGPIRLLAESLIHDLNPEPSAEGRFLQCSPLSCRP